ncbi:hypothetical protein HRbin08_00204 [bacterium HR08]|nr:hypothetical protein HRbin08_00204 [bacterium HR08]
MCGRGVHCLALLAFLVIGVTLTIWSGGRRPLQREEPSNPREAALETLSLLPDEIRDIERREQRLELIIRIADILRSEDPERARGLLTRAFQETLSDEGGAKDDHWRGKWSALQRRIISRIAQHDEGLAKRLLDELHERSASAETTSSAQVSYVQFARGLIENHPDLAGYMVRRRMRTLLNWEGLLFLLDLREKARAQADLLFLDLTSQVASQGAGDVNELLLLYAYVFSPALPMQLTGEGPRMFSLPGYRRGPVDSEMAVRFLQRVIPPLLAPERYAGRGPLWGPRGDFFFLSVILPHCHRFLPALADELERQRNLLAALFPQGERASLERAASRPPSSLAPHPDGGEDLLEKAERATDPKVRDRLFFLALDRAIRKGNFEQAFEIAEKISPERRQEILSFVHYLVAERAIRAGNLAEALERVRRPMKPSLKAYLLALIAHRQFASDDPSEAMRSLIEAEQITRKLEPDRVKASLLLGLSVLHGLMNSPSAFLTLQEAVEVINRAKDFDGEVSLGNLITVGDFSFAYEVDARVFSFELPFSLLGARDFYGTMAFARALAHPVLRARAVIAACAGALKGRSASGGTEARIGDRD